MSIYLPHERVSRRLARVAISAEDLVNLLLWLDGNLLVRTENLPGDARVVGAEVCGGRWPPEIVLYLESAEFPLVAPGEMPLERAVTFSWSDLRLPAPEE